MSANYTFNNFRFDRSEKGDGLTGGTSLTVKNTTAFSLSPLLALTPTISFQSQNNTVQPQNTVSTSGSAPPKMDAVMALIKMKPQDALTPSGPNQVGAAKIAETKTAQAGGVIQQAKQQMAALDPKAAANNTVMTPPPPSPTISFGGAAGPSFFATSSSKKDKGTPMYMTAPTPDPAMNAANFTATPASAVVAARNNGVNGLGSQGGRQIMEAANTAGDYLKDLKLMNLDKKMAEIGQRNFAIGAAARNTLIDAGLRSPTASPVAMVLRPDAPGKPSPVSA